MRKKTGNSHVSELTEQELRAVIREEFKGTLAGLGVTTENPFEVQKDFAFVRAWRKSSEAIRGKGILTIITVFVTGAIGLLWVGIKTIFSGLN